MIIVILREWQISGSNKDGRGSFLWYDVID